MDFEVPAVYKVKLKESQKTLLENWKKMEQEIDDDTTCN